MRKTILLLILLAAGSLAVNAQQQYVLQKTNVVYQDITLDQALKKAGKNNQLIMLQFQNAAIAGYRITLRTALANDTVSDFLNKNFTNLLIDVADTVHNKAIMKKYEVNENGWEFVFVNKEGTVKYRFGGSWIVVNKKKFMDYLDNALQAENKAGNEGISFVHEPLPSALKIAASSNKLLFVDCYITWCAPCAEMATNVFPQKELGDFFNPKFVSVKLDMESPEGKEFNKRHKITAYPSFLLLNAKEELIGEVIGGMDGKQFIERVSQELEKMAK